jgi:hypothetical protein
LWELAAQVTIRDRFRVDDGLRPINVHEMMDYVRAYLRITQARPTVVKNYFRERHVRYAAS